MADTVILAACQPPWASDHRSPARVRDIALELAELAADRGATVLVLPEYANVPGMRRAEALACCDETAEEMTARLAELARRRGLWVLLPLLLRRDGKLRNTAVFLSPDGPIGYYDKVHLARAERDQWGIVAGDDYPVFETPWGRVGIMICYDVCFPEAARILAVRGADVIFFPSLQRSYTERHLELQVRSRAYDNFVWVVRSSYGTPREEGWAPGQPVGKSCIAAPDGTLVADAGRWVGFALAEAPLAWPEKGPVSYSGPIEPLRQARMADRRPETYGPLAEEAPGADD